MVDNSNVLGSIPCRVGYLSSGAYTVLQTVQRPGVCRSVYGIIVNYKEQLNSFEMSTA